MTYSAQVSRYVLDDGKWWLDCKENNSFFHPDHGVKVGSILRDTTIGKAYRVLAVDREHSRIRVEFA